jgi:arginine-tRNA-protein transferase
MSGFLDLIPPDLAFYATPPHPCSYLEDRRAVTLFTDPKAGMSPEVYSALAEVGFRRSGEYVYRPRCPRCEACIPARIPVTEFVPNRSQRRIARANADVTVTPLPAEYREEHFLLYRRYIRSRHADSGMDVDSVEQYLSFLTSTWSDTRFVEFRHGRQLLAVSVVDRMSQGLSAVYTFFEPDSKRGLGVNAVLWQLGEARRQGLPYLFLGYLIDESPKMAYKRQYTPLELFLRGQWQRPPPFDRHGPHPVLKSLRRRPL